MEHGFLLWYENEYGEPESKEDIDHQRACYSAWKAYGKAFKANIAEIIRTHSEPQRDTSHSRDYLEGYYKGKISVVTDLHSLM